MQNTEEEQHEAEAGVVEEVQEVKTDDAGDADKDTALLVDQPVRNSTSGLVAPEADASEVVEVSPKKKKKGKGKEDKGTDDKTYHLPTSLHIEACYNFLDRLTIRRSTEPPPIPFSRTVKHDVVRVVTDGNVSGIVKNMKKMGGFFDNLAGLIVSVYRDVTDEDRSGWNAIQLMQHQAFEDAIQAGKVLDSGELEWGFLSNKVFRVWDGNHRRRAIEVLQSQEPDRSVWYPVVKTRIVNVEDVNEISLIQALRSINEATGTVAPTTLIHTLEAVRSMCGKSKATTDIIAKMNDEDKDIIARWKKGEGADCWYPFPKPVCAKLLFDSELKQELARIDASTNPKLDKAKERKNTISKYVAIVSKMLAIVDPARGDGWYDALTRVVMDDSTSQIIYIEKLYLIATADVSPEERVRYLQLLLTLNQKSQRATYGLTAIGDRDWNKFMYIDVYWKKVKETALGILTSLQKTDGISVLVDFGEWYDEQRAYRKLDMYMRMYNGKLTNRFGSQVKNDKLFELDESARRMIIRFLRAHEVTLPATVKNWFKSNQVPQMWSRLTPTTSTFERQTCPFWLDYEDGKYSLSEEEDFEQHRRDPKSATFAKAPDSGDAILEKQLVRLTTRPPKPKHDRKKSKPTPGISEPSEPIDVSEDEMDTHSAPVVRRLRQRLTKRNFVEVSEDHTKNTSQLESYGHELWDRFPSSTRTSGRYIIVQTDARAFADSILQEDRLDRDVQKVDGFVQNLPFANGIDFSGGLFGHPFVDLFIVDPPPSAEDKMICELVGFASTLLTGTGYIVLMTLPVKIPTVHDLIKETDCRQVQLFFINRKCGWLTSNDGHMENLLAVQVFQMKDANRTESLNLKSSMVFDNIDVEDVDWSVQPKSLKLMSFIVDQLSRHSSVVWDLCLGAGASALAAVTSSRHFIGMDCDPDMVAYARSRIEKLTKVTAAEPSSRPSSITLSKWKLARTKRIAPIPTQLNKDGESEATASNI